ncbi:MAG: ribosome maturation factor RimP [Pseudomonadota bacterium]
MIAETDLHEERLAREDGPAGRVAELAEPVATDLGYRIVRVRISGQNGKTVQIMAERPDGTMSVQDCETLSKTLSPVLDLEDPIEGAYHLEISSPGIDRPLVRRSDFQRWIGSLAKIETRVTLEGRRRFRGIIDGIDGDYVEIGLTEALPDGSISVQLAFDAIGEAKLIMTDDLIKAALRADKQAAKDRSATAEETNTESGTA